MNAANSWKSYRQIATQTAPPGQLVLMLFDGALHSLERALTGFDYNDPCEKNQTIHNNLQRAVDIIRQLNNSLNLEAGGKLAETLRNLYHYFDRRIVESNFKKQRDGLDEVIAHLKELRDAWATMLASQGQVSSLQTEPDDSLLSDARAA
ncbi:MAG TPA: flagellar export chaperone FliS [Verrucomicrobiae bacterium]|jgi:flagellar protein FliS|nr:flagellar export chaperone FliS [Verrucomicrobiae bacterium]